MEKSGGSATTTPDPSMLHVDHTVDALGVPIIDTISTKRPC